MSAVAIIFGAGFAIMAGLCFYCQYRWMAVIRKYGAAWRETSELRKAIIEDGDMDSCAWRTMTAQLSAPEPQSLRA